MGKHLGILILSFFLFNADISANIIPNQVGNTRALKNVENLDDNGKIILGWEVDEVKEIITFEIEAETTGYVGFGISPQGSMTGADIFIAGVNSDGSSYFSDRHGTGFVEPTVDVHPDWTLLNATEAGGKTFLRFSRPLDSCDDEDYPITKDTNRIIWAMGATDTIYYHKATGRGSKSLNLLWEPLPEIDLGSAKQWEMTLNMTMPAEDTAYWCSFHKSPMLNETHHIIAFDAFLPNELAIQHTHHFIVYNCYLPQDSNQTMDEIFGNFTVDKGHKGDFCYHPPELAKLPTEYCQEYLFVWAKGGKRFVLPDTLGYPIGNDNGQQKYYMLEIHYDNPEKRDDAIFNTGLTIYYTDKLRSTAVGQLTIGHDVTPALLVPPNEKNFVVSGHCSTGCTKNKFPEGGITVFNVMLHSHLSGRKLKIRHFRDGKELEWLDYDDHYDFNYQQNKPLAKEVKVLPGDQLTYECTYDSTWKNGSVVIGDLSTKDEMCEAFLWYYPKIEEVDICASGYDLYRSFGDLGITKIATVPVVGQSKFYIEEPEYLKGDFEESISFKYNWTDKIRERHQDMRRYGVHQAICVSRKAYETYVEFVTYPYNFTEYVPENVCPRNNTETSGSDRSDRIAFNLILGAIFFGLSKLF